MRSVEFLAALLDRGEPAGVAAEDWDGEHGPALRVWQRMGFLDREPGMHPSPGCPNCGEGVPYAVGGRHLCPACRSPVGPRHLCLWRLHADALMSWLAGQLGLQGGVRPTGDHLWRLGTWARGRAAFECFSHRGERLSDADIDRLSIFRNTLLFNTPALRPAVGRLPLRYVSLIDLLRMDDSLTVADLDALLRPRGTVWFNSESGALRAGNDWLGEVPVGSKEYFFLARLAAELDRYVPYADLKHYVQFQSGGRDETEEATYCQNLKSRIKKKWIPKIDQLIATTNKNSGYQLRGHVELID